jgi:hypothetical protein
MNGTVNGVLLRNIISIRTLADGVTRQILKIIGAPLPEPEQQLKLSGPALQTRAELEWVNETPDSNKGIGYRCSEFLG